MFWLLKCRFRWEWSSRLPVRKKCSFTFCPWKGFRTHVSKIVQYFSSSFFFASPQAKNDFWLVHPCGQRSNFTDFVQRAATAIIKLTQFYLATSYKVPSISSQRKYGNFSWNIFHTSVIRGEPLRPLFAYHNSPNCTKEFSKCRRSSG